MLQLDENINSQLILDQIGHSKRSRYKKGFGVAVMAMALVGAFVLLNKNKKEPLATDQILLSMDNGEVVNLERADTAIQSGSLSLHNANKTLKFNGAGGTGSLYVPAGKFYNLVLSDGTTMMVNSVTKVKFPFKFSGATREIWVDGEAYIDVALDSKQLFVVHLPNSQVKVLGTSFNVNTFDSKENVSLVTGKVRLITKKDSVTLSPGKQANIQADSISVFHFKQEQVLSWMKGIYFFDDATMEEVAQVLPRWYGVTVKLDPGVKKKQFYGIIDRNQPLKEFLERLKSTQEVDYILNDNIVTIK
jgi:ferric-dicitrate binding protein FerR (iron transport regulator)